MICICRSKLGRTAVGSDLRLHNEHLNPQPATFAGPCAAASSTQWRNTESITSNLNRVLSQQEYHNQGLLIPLTSIHSRAFIGGRPQQDTMSTIWELASRRPSLISTEQPEVDHPNNLAAILEEARARIPFIPSSNLKFDSFLGKGACFEVSRELYARTGVEDFQPFYVAVKHIVTHNVPGYDLEVPYASVRREIQVLTHAGFKNAPNIISLLGYGMAEYPGTLSPYLVVEYSEEGHLSDFLRAARWSKDPPRSLERCELALDIATGLKTLHENHIIHGDLKLANILVFPYAGIPAVREFQAKLADFGAAIVEHEAQASKYTGTLIYNAPEQRDYRLKAKYCSARRFYQADVWSFGLALVEVMDQGKRYLKAEWKNGDESDYEFLDRVFAEEHDGLLERTCHDEPDDGMANVHSAVIETLRITLRDDPETRASMDEVVDTLSVIFSKAIR